MKNFQMLKTEYDCAPKEHDYAPCLKKNQAKLLKVEHGLCTYLARTCVLSSLQNFNSFEHKHDRASSAVKNRCYKLLEFSSLRLLNRI